MPQHVTLASDHCLSDYCKETVRLLVIFASLIVHYPVPTPAVVDVWVG